MIEDIKDAKDQLIDYFGDEKKLKKASEDEVNDAIHELADSNCDIYTSDILEWVTKDDNYWKVEEATDELGFPESEGKPDILKAIQYGQFLRNEELLQEALEELC